MVYDRGWGWLKFVEAVWGLVRTNGGRMGTI